MITFTVDSAGNVDYSCDPMLNSCLESCVSGRGTNLLRITCGPAAICGNSVVDGCEQCDRAASPTGCAAGQTCTSSCTCQTAPGTATPTPTPSPTSPPGCGNRVIIAPEECDDGNTTDGDGCSASCQSEDGWTCAGQPSVCAPTCGDGKVRGSEKCDLGPENGQLDSGCTSDCKLRGQCTTSRAGCTTAADCPAGQGCCGNGTT